MYLNEWDGLGIPKVSSRPALRDGRMSERHLRPIEAAMFPHICITFKKPPFSAELDRILEIKATKKELSPLMSDNI